MRRTLLLLTLVAAALMVAAPMAFAAVRTGTDASETLNGTNEADRMTGKGGDDVTNGKRGNDLYNYADGWGIDVVRDSGGRDTLNLSQVTTHTVARLCTDGTDGTASMGYATGGAGNGVAFGKGVVPEVTQNAPMENIKLGPGSGQAVGCGLDNGFSPGGGSDEIIDYGGIVIPDQIQNFPKSDEVYSGLGRADQVAFILDGGGKDVASLKPLRTGQVDLRKKDSNRDGTADTLYILTGEESYIMIQDANNTMNGPGATLDGRIEQVAFKDRTLSSTQLMNRAFEGAPLAAQAMDEGGPEVLDPAAMLEGAELP